MTVEINRSQERDLTVTVNVHELGCHRYGVINLGQYPDRVTMLLDFEVLGTLSSRIDHAIRVANGDDHETVEREVETVEESPALRCDDCGHRLIIVGRSYRHYDPSEDQSDPDRGWFGCRYVADGWTGDGFANIGGSSVPTDEILATLSVDELL